MERRREDIMPFGPLIRRLLETRITSSETLLPKVRQALDVGRGVETMAQRNSYLEAQVTAAQVREIAQKIAACHSRIVDAKAVIAQQGDLIKNYDVALDIKLRKLHELLRLELDHIKESERLEQERQERLARRR